jgi:hypothetical protein
MGKECQACQVQRNAQAHAQNPPHRRNLNSAFTAADYHQYNTPIRNIAEAALLIQQLPQHPETERFLELTQHAIVQLDQWGPMSLLQHSHSRSECHASSIPQASRTRGGRPNPRGNDNHQYNQDNRGGHDHQHAQCAARGHADQEVQQHPCQSGNHQVARP